MVAKIEWMAQNPIIIIADDDSDDRLLIREALREYSPLVDTVEVEDGVELLQMMGRYEKNSARPHAIILDINMPRMDGVDALAILRARHMLPDVPIFVLSTMRDRNRVQESLQYGVAGVCTKPNSHSELKSIIRDFCDKALAT